MRCRLHLIHQHANLCGAMLYELLIAKLTLPPVLAVMLRAVQATVVTDKLVLRAGLI